MARQKRVLGAADALSPEKASKSRRLKLHILQDEGALQAAPAETVVKSPHVVRLEAACIGLRPGYPTGRLMPCRTPERRKIVGHLRSAIAQGGTTQVLYVSGMPGTGKTAVVLEAIHQLKLQCKAKPTPLPEFTFVHVNAMRLSAPVQVFREIADQLLLNTSNGQACSNVTELFMARKAEDPVVVLLIDEVDCLSTPTQAVLYKLFDWLGMPNARLVLAAISNTMDLPERLLPRVASRFHIERADFEAYSKIQIYDILCNRLKGQGALDAFGDVVLRLCAARVAGATGDVRKALQVCRRAVETRLQKPEAEGPITIANLEEAEKEIILVNPLSQAVLGLSTQARRFLSAVVIELQRKGGNVVLLRKATSRFEKVCGMTALESERGSAAVDLSNAAFDAAAAVELEGSVAHMAGRLQAMGILNIQVPSPSAELASGGPALSLGALDWQDLASTLLKSEEDPVVCELLEGGNPDAAAARRLKNAGDFELVD